MGKIETDKNKNKAEDVYAKTSERKGLYGIAETIFRRFRTITYLAALIPLYAVCILAMGISAIPGVYFFYFISDASVSWPEFFHYAAIGLGIFVGFFLYGLSLIFVVPLMNFVIPLRLKPFRGGFYSLPSVPWYIHNALTYVVRYTFLEYFTPTPLSIFFYRMMGMKIGKDSHINTTNISDPCLIEIGDRVTIGGSATIIAHYAMQGYLIVDKVKIGHGVTIGLKATIMGDVEIGEGASIGPHEVVFPKSRIPAGRKFEK
ncbi:MAG TPA: hypothetical protein VI583_13745 [Cyclobacteriaceae bacterium]|nr:hypothetical protein [Cyclobacteriaceae bacterium]